MAIVRPSEEEARNLPPEQPIMVDSDADTHNHAIMEIELWCRPLGLLRAQENLRAFTVDGRIVRRGICYRPSPVWTAARHAAFEAAVRAVDTMPKTQSSVEIL